MSDPQNTATPAAVPASPVTPSPVIDSVGTGPNQVIFEAPKPVETPPVAAPPVAPEPYRVAELENGQYEVTLESGQVYRGTQKDVLGELAKAQFHATRTIAEMKGKIPAPVEPPPVVPGQIDPTAAALADLTAQGFGFKDAAELKQYLNPVPQLQQFMEQQQLNNTAAQFLAATPDFPNSDANANKIDATLAQFGLPPTVEALQLVHNHLKATGQYERVATAAQNTAKPLPTPPNGYTQEPQAVDPWSIPLEQLGQMIRRS